MPALVLDERIYETSVTTGTGEYTLAGAVTGFQPCSVLSNGNYGYFFITDDTNWEVVIGTYVSGPDRLQRTHVLASSNGDAAVNWGAGTKKIRCGLPAFYAQPKQTSKSVAGSADVTLTALEQRVQQLVLTGVLTGDIDVIVDTTKWAWEVYNNTSGSYTVTVKTSAGTGVVATQGKRSLLACDGTNVVSALDDLVSPSIAGTMALTGVISPSQITSNQNDYNPTGLSTASVLRINSDAARDITGLQGGSSGRVVMLHNVGSFPITLKDSVTSTAAYQFALNSDIVIGADQSVQLQYDATSSRWRLVGAVTEINGLTALTAVDQAADYLLVYDASVGVIKKATPDSLLGGVRPSFAATASGGQSIGATTAAKIQFATEVFDTNANYDNVTNYRFTPTVAGKYLVTVSITIGAISDGKLWLAQIYKNGSELARGGSAQGAIAAPSASIMAIVDMNGSTDYIEAYGYNGDASSQNLGTTAGYNYFSAARIA